MTENERLTNSDKEIPTLDDNAEYWLQVYFKLKDYEAIGTVEEFEVLKEKNVAKKPLRVPTDDTCLYYEFRCPSCGVWLSREIKRTHCKCNQKLDWQ